MYIGLSAFYNRLSTCKPQQLGSSWNAIPRSFSYSLRSISLVWGGKGFCVFPLMTISHVLDKFSDILFSIAQLSVFITSAIAVLPPVLTGALIVISSAKLV